MRHIMGVDIGGTFTDFSLIDDRGGITLWKEATTPADPGVAVQRGLEALADAQGWRSIPSSAVWTSSCMARPSPRTR